MVVALAFQAKEESSILSFCFPVVHKGKIMLKKLAILAVCFIGSQSFAGELFLGRIVSAAGADTTNATTAAPFVVPQSQTITIQCDAIAYVITDDSTAVSATRGVYLTARQLFLTSTSNQEIVVVSSQVSAVVRIAGPAAVNCIVWSNRGNE